jgi:hypothetical protein
MKIKIHNLAVFFAVAASAVLLGTVGSARAADQWFVMGEQALKSADSSTEIKSQGGRCSGTQGAPHMDEDPIQDSR